MQDRVFGPRANAGETATAIIATIRATTVTNTKMRFMRATFL